MTSDFINGLIYGTNTEGSNRMSTTTEKAYTTAEHLKIRAYLLPYIARNYNENEEKHLDKLLAAGAFDLDRVLELSTEAEAIKEQRKRTRQNKDDDKGEVV